MPERVEATLGASPELDSGRKAALDLGDGVPGNRPPAPKSVPGSGRAGRLADRLGVRCMGDALGLVDAMAQVAVRTAPRVAPARLARLGQQWGEVLLGCSAVTPDPRDWRFSNKAWSENPVLRRVAQSYLAWCDAMSDLVAESGLDWRAEERARFAAGLVMSAMAPTNNLFLNPDAIQRAVETSGRSVLRGLGNIGRDVLENGGLPRPVVRGGFRVGHDLAATAGAVVHTSEVCELLQYRPLSDTVRQRPVVVVPPQINKYYVMDLAPGRSFVEYALRRGYQVFAVSWRNPTPREHHWGLDTYTDALEEALTVANNITGADAANLVSVCAGGITSAALMARLAARGVDMISSLTLAVTHLDYDERSMLGMLGDGALVERARRMAERQGGLDSLSLSALFALLRPNDLVWKYWVNNNLLGQDPPRFDVLAWNSDGTFLPSRLHSDFLDIFGYNLLARGDLLIDGEPAALDKIDRPTLVMGARNDHLVPWKACYATTRLLGGEVDFVLSSSGHIQSLVSPPATPRMTVATARDTPPDPEEWLGSAEERPGVWWEVWDEWQRAHAGRSRRAPTRLGNGAHPPEAPAPGRYVLND